MCRLSHFIVFILIFACSTNSQASTNPAHLSEESLQNQLNEAQMEINSLRQMIQEIQQQLGTDVRPDTSENLEARVEELETIALDLDDAVGDRAVIKAFDAIKFDLGGFLDTTSSIVIGESNTTIAANQQVFELLANAELGDRWDIFLAQAFVRNAPLSFDDPQGINAPQFANNNSPIVTDTVIAWGQYAYSDLINIQFGRYITPIGIINVEHFPATLLDTSQPMFLRPFPGQTLFANFSNGINIHGSQFVGANKNNKLEYSLFGGAWSGNSNALTAGGRVRYTISEHGLNIGINVYTGDRSSTQEKDRFVVTGADLQFIKGPFSLKTETFYSSENFDEDRFAFYIQPAFEITSRLTAFYRYDFLDRGGIGERMTEQVVGLVYNPIPNIRLRSLYRHQSFTDETGIIDAATDSIQISTTLNF